MKRITLVILILFALIGIFIFVGSLFVYKGFRQSTNMKGILASNLNLPELNGVKVNVGEVFDKKYTCDGENINPQIILPDRGVYAIILEDPDAPAGTWFHWGLIIWNSTEVPEGLPKELKGNNFYQTYNDFYYYNFTRGNIKGVGYDGPCPPPGHGYHRYFFEIFKLRSKPSKEIIQKEDLIRFIEENAESVYIYMAKYKR